MRHFSLFNFSARTPPFRFTRPVPPDPTFFFGFGLHSPPIPPDIPPRQIRLQRHDLRLGLTRPLHLVEAVEVGAQLSFDPAVGPWCGVRSERARFFPVLSARWDGGCGTTAAPRRGRVGMGRAVGVA